MILGIDPGLKGGLAWVSRENALAWKMPETERDLWTLILSVKKNTEHAYIEKVHSSPQMGVKSAFTFGRNQGMLRAFLVAAEIPFEEVLPSKWQRALGCLSGGDKNVTKRKAQELFPEMKITHSTADALLIATYGARVRVWP